MVVTIILIIIIIFLFFPNTFDDQLHQWFQPDSSGVTTLMSTIFFLLPVYGFLNPSP